MRHPGAGQINPKLRELVAEASCALARLDSARLEELALSCEALNRGLDKMSAEEKADLAHQAREAAAGMAVFARVLEADTLQSAGNGPASRITNGKAGI